MTAEERDQARADLTRVRSEAERAAKIVRNLLAFVRRSPVERQETDINELVKSTLSLRAYEMTNAGIIVEEHYAAGLPPVAVNRGEIQQVLVNLILNAEQAMQSVSRRGRLTLRTALTSRGIAIEVQDDGPGVPPAIAGHIFEPFYSTKEVGQGTGLGLSIALGIAEAHEGSLALIPTPSGACFRLTLPTAAEWAEAPAGTARRRAEMR